MCEISISTVENIDEVEQISLQTTCSTKLYRYYRVTLNFLVFTKKNFRKFHLQPLLNPPFITFARVQSLLKRYPRKQMLFAEQKISLCSEIITFYNPVLPQEVLSNHPCLSTPLSLNISETLFRRHTEYLERYLFILYLNQEKLIFQQLGLKKP